MDCRDDTGGPSLLFRLRTLWLICLKPGEGVKQVMLSVVLKNVNIALTTKN